MSIPLTLRPVGSTSLEVWESPKNVSPDESPVYALTTTVIGDSPSSPAVRAINAGNGVDVSAQVLSGSPSASDNVITLPTIQNLVKGQQYRIEIDFTIGSVPYTRYLRLFCNE